jgi:hypothetical protein
MAGVVIAVLLVVALAVLAQGGGTHGRATGWAPQGDWRERDPRA